TEDEPVNFGDAQFAWPVILHAERRRHPSLAVDAVLEGNTRQVALSIVRPGVIHAAELLDVAALLERDQRAAMGASVREGIELAVAIARDDDRCVTDEGRTEIADVCDLDRKAQEIPNRPANELALLGRVDLRILKHPVGNAS